MLKLHQIKGDLMFKKLGKSSVDIIENEWEEAIGSIVKDGRFEFINDWYNHNNNADFLSESECWWELQTIFHKYIRKALAKQGIKEGTNTIRVGKKSITVELIKGDDECWSHDIFGLDHKIDCTYYCNSMDNSYAISSVMNMAIDNEQLLIDYLLYTDNIIAELKSKLREVVIWQKNIIEEHTYERCSLNSLGLDHLMNGCNDLLNEYQETA